MNKKLLAYFVTGAISLGAIGGASTLSIAKAATNTPAKIQSSVQNNLNQPNYNGSIKVPNQNNTKDGAKGVKDNEANESAKLKSLAKITEIQAKDAALKAVTGTVNKIELDNENGNLVYSVDIKTNKGSVDVKVDAGSGMVLSQDNGGDNESKGKETSKETEKSNTPDKDNIQVEQQGEYQN
ncbi:PepSY domain-containing protein [Thermoanaerobacterium sp. RBIITD]|uniref:PepSY domain-containing protein n=1 Tax=Thermoanaerobacterium sp. RBIITD TaxID=1550240 RepID=UPI000BC0E733|nr:PepSY domain-containing protein [Thermoanaerobacterium sp. RBIITD]SNX53287.1 Peptidase propeptide and YPEB domain-containing protein [Thermoanaerobacterium sp. RBIITD]